MGSITGERTTPLFVLPASRGVTHSSGEVPDTGTSVPWRVRRYRASGSPTAAALSTPRGSRRGEEAGPGLFSRTERPEWDLPWRTGLGRQSYAGLLGVACTVNAPEKPPSETLQLTVVVAPLATSGAMPALQVPIDFPFESDRLKVTVDGAGAPDTPVRFLTVAATTQFDADRQPEESTESTS